MHTFNKSSVANQQPETTRRTGHRSAVYSWSYHVIFAKHFTKQRDRTFSCLVSTEAKYPGGLLSSAVNGMRHKKLNNRRNYEVVLRRTVGCCFFQIMIY